MKIGFVVNQIETETGGYSTTQLSSAAVHRGHEVYLISVGQLCYLEDGKMGAIAIKAPTTKFRSLDKYMEAIHSPEAERMHISTDDLDVLFLRNNPCEEFGERAWAQTAGMVFGQVASVNGVLVVNDPYALMSSFNKMYFQHFPEAVRPRTIISRDADEIKTFYKKEKKKIILKPLQGSGGKDVFLVDNDKNLNQIVETINRYGFVIAQEYLPAAKNGDIRVIMMNGKILEINGKVAAVNRVNNNDIRSNLHSGGQAIRAEITDDVRRLCEIVGPKLVQDGMFLAGIDIVGDKIMELNLDSPGTINAMHRLEGEDFSSAIIDSLEKKVEYQKHYDGTLPNAFLATMNL
ncbi:glutathione synthase [Algoriphagus ratkowskyi]|uniref:ATP-grasp domain-containing protein n=1 Tax=Algoriphagus ratkowskyi TaxID=57028 RepID=A0A2W7RQR8_9BACT|nr:ATP-grasp domain-containing protein [Algoriphagus ratkowskyi]PZX61276.1 glutathione synthase [Algoriphagus ratkowskyi]TXD79390.1 ATP-grasp domain-containing protein [Algoriphagus ratkowskyi]